MSAKRSQAGCKEIAPLISIAQAVRESGLTRRMLDGLVQKGTVGTFELPTGRRLLRRVDLENLRREGKP